MITVTSYGRDAGSARVRIFDWLEHLNVRAENLTYLDAPTNGVATLLRNPIETLRAEARVRSFASKITAENLLLSRQATPFSNGGIEARLLRNAAHGVYDFDDALMLKTNLGGLRAKLWSKQKTWRKCVSAADVVIAGNEYLAEAASQYAEKVVTIPSCVEPTKYRVKSSYEIGPNPTAVWLGSPSTEPYLHSIAPALRAANTETGLRLLVISAGSASLGDLDSMVDRVQWTEDTFADDLAKADVGLMPLADNDWERGKCAYKLLQYGAAGLPSIGSPVGANRDVLARTDGIAASSQAEWRDSLIGLVRESEATRRTRGAKARQTVRERFSYEAWAERWSEAAGLSL